MPTVDTPRITATGTYPRITVNVVTGATGPGGGAVDSVNGQTGTVVLDAADVGALPDDTVIPDITGLQATSEKNQPNGYAGLDGDGTIPDNRIPSSIARDSEIGTQVSAHNTDGSAHSVRFAAKTDFPATNNHVPVRDGSGAQGSIRYTSGTTGYTIAYRTEDGQIGVAAPTDDSHAVNRGHLAASGKGFVNHGATAGTARPVGYVSVEWLGSVQPSNWVAGDTWVRP